MRGDVPDVTPDKVDYMDVSPKPARFGGSRAIPFLENDDATAPDRASNMHRQAVPLVRAERVVGTGMEGTVARDSALRSLRAAPAWSIRWTPPYRRPCDRRSRSDQSGVDIYRLMKFQRFQPEHPASNQRPLVKVGDQVKKGIHRGRSLDRSRRSSRSAQRAGRVHA